jgi:predicted NAD/FAD-dependent oxidoreductase
MMADCLIVGAGIAGLMAARLLHDRGWAVTVLDKAGGVGGRMATRRIQQEADQAIVDFGAQFFTVRSAAFERWVQQWQELGVVQEWSRGFAEGAEPYRPDGHARYRGTIGMTGISKQLARGLDVRLRTAVRSVVKEETGWQIMTEDGESLTADALIMTPPVPQSLALLAAGGVALPAGTQSALEHIAYDPCLAVLAVLDGPSDVPAPGGLRPEHPIIYWLADNQQKGISPLPAVTIHAGPDFSREHYAAAQEAATKEEVMQKILAAAAPWLGADVVSAQLHRWRYSAPVDVYAEPCLVVPGRYPLIFAGDAFAGPRVEGAALSGRAAAWTLLFD